MKVVITIEGSLKQMTTQGLSTSDSSRSKEWGAVCLLVKPFSRLNFHED